MTERPHGRRHLRADPESVTGPLSAILGVATVVLLIAVYAFFVSRLGSHAPDTVDSGAKADFSADGYQISPSGPENIPVATGRLLVTIDGVNSTVPLSFFNPQLGNSPTWDVGVKLCIVGDAATCYKHSGTNVQVTAVANNNIVFTTGALHAPGPGFTVGPNGGIDISRNGTASTLMVGAAITCGANGPAVPVYADFTTDGGATYQALFSGAQVTPSGGQTYNSNLLKGQQVGVRGTADSPSCGNFHAAFDSLHADPHVEVLKAGDPAPNVPAFGNQASVDSFLRPYVNTQTLTMVLQPNQVIILFEFSSPPANPPNSAADFQDLVVLFTFP